jgi:hypothetical protein
MATASSALLFATSSERSAHVSKADQVAFALAEAAINNGRAALYGAPDPRNSGAVPEQSVAYAGGTATHVGTLAGTTWTLTGTGRVGGTNGSADVVRRLTARVRISTGSASSANNAIWNYLYADSLASCTTLSNNVTIDIPFYVRGNLCMNNSSSVRGDYLQVGGTLTINNSASAGSAGDPLVEARIAGGCRLGSGAFVSPCGVAQRVWATTANAQPQGLTKPPVDLAHWYDNAQPGPKKACTTGTFPGGFDNDATLNRSRATVDLMPVSPYDCRVFDAGGAVVGRLTWTPGNGSTPGTLVVAGTIFFDGDVSLSGNDYGIYSGRATIYASGRISLSNNTRLCGVSSCDGAWDASQNLLAFVAGAPSGDGFTMANNALLQGAVYAVADFRESNSAVVWGPVIADQLYIANSGLNHYVPMGTLLPGMPATYDEVTVLENVEGGFGE